MDSSLTDTPGDVFRRNVEALTSHLRDQYNLEVIEDDFRLFQGWKVGHVALANDFVRIKFLAGVPREQYVVVTIHPRNDDSRVAKRGLNLGGYASKLGIRECFPESYSEETRRMFYSFGSVVQITSHVIFLSVHCKEFLLGEKSPLDAM